MNVYTGIPFGPSGLWNDRGTVVWGPAPFTSSTNPTTPSGIVRQIDAARAMNQKLILNMTGGSHERYKTNGKFDLAKWTAVMNTFNTSEIKAAVAAAVADGTVLLNNVMDEPNISDWGGVPTKALLDEMAAYVDAIFPTLPTGVTHRSDWRVEERYQVMDAIFAQYTWRRGDVIAFRDSALAMAQRENMAVVFSLNILGGGIFDRTTKACPIPLTGGYGIYPPLCRMTPDQVRDWGLILGPAGCAMSLWMYDRAFMENPENQRAFEDVAATLAAIPGRPCRRGAGSPPPTNIPPKAVFDAPSCSTGVFCQFNDGSSDSDGIIASWDWTFGDGNSSSLKDPMPTFAAANTYTVTLAVTDDKGATNSVSRNVTVTQDPPSNQPPIAAFVAASCTVGVPCQFNDGSSDNDGDITTRSWEFGNGETSSETNPSTMFVSVGDYHVTLTVTDNDEATNSISHSVTVVPPNSPPTAAFTVPSCTAGKPCQFTDGSHDDDGTIATRSWTFGNGATSTAAKPSVTYAAAGSFSVALTVTDDDGASNSVTRSVAVAPGTPPTRIVLKVTGRVDATKQYMTLTWTGMAGTTTTVYRDSRLITNTVNDGRYTNSRNYLKPITYVYKICQAGTSTCSSSASVTFK